MNDTIPTRTDALLFTGYAGFLLSLAFACRAGCSIAIALIALSTLFKNKQEAGQFLLPKTINLHFAACISFFLLQLTALAYTCNLQAGWRPIELKSALVFIPWCLYGGRFINPARFALLMKLFIVFMAAAIAWCLCFSFIQYRFYHAGITVFFYHALLQSLGHHAIQFSILVFAVLAYLLQIIVQQTYIVNKQVHSALIVYFIVAILLLSSKLVIVFLTGYLLYFLWTIIQQNSSARWMAFTLGGIGIAGACLLLFTSNPVSHRFADSVHGSVAIVQQATFDPGYYFNGVQFRLLQWRFVVELLQEQHAWLLGVSPADAQGLLNQKYIQTHMYTGVPGTGMHGFLGYNTHNQLLEALLQTGLLGLCCFIVIIVALLRMVIAQKSRLLSAVVLLLLAYAFTESVFETQYGLILFNFLPLFIYFGVEKSHCTFPGFTCIL